ncbi:MAG: FTR1 family iron permease, partial [Ardenticatenaceae bacterium]
VAVLLYVSHWLFQKTYIHDWKAYLEEHLGRAVTRGSAFAMAGLAFAAVYREGFETVLFYQALMFDAGAAAVLAGFLPGIVVIAAIGYGIVRLGLRLPLKRVFAVTGSVLLYLAFVFIGKGLYNLQEAGVFAPHPLAWVPDHEALRQLLGLYPLAETLLAQGAFLALLGLGAIWYRTRSRDATQAVSPPQPDPRSAAATATPALSSSVTSYGPLVTHNE